jgi:hypothetical protein
LLLVVACGSESPQSNADASGSETDGGSTADGGSADAREGLRRVFVTAAVHSADLRTEGAATSGLVGADNLCAAAAMDADLGGTWTAWLSDSSTDAIDRIDDVGPWVEVVPEGIEPEEVFADKANLETLPLRPISRDEEGNVTTNPVPSSVFTGTMTGGRNSGSSTCEDWTSEKPYGMAGDLASSAEWTALLDDYCGAAKRLYCFEQ